jgi:hypothetical protein
MAFRSPAVFHVEPPPPGGRITIRISQSSETSLRFCTQCWSASPSAARPTVAIQNSHCGQGRSAANPTSHPQNSPHRRSGGSPHERFHQACAGEWWGTEQLAKWRCFAQSQFHVGRGQEMLVCLIELGISNLFLHPHCLRRPTGSDSRTPRTRGSTLTPQPQAATDIDMGIAVMPDRPPSAKSAEPKRAVGPQLPTGETKSHLPGALGNQLTTHPGPHSRGRLGEAHGRSKLVRIIVHRSGLSLGLVLAGLVERSASFDELPHVLKRSSRPSGSNPSQSRSSRFADSRTAFRWTRPTSLLSAVSPKASVSIRAWTKIRSLESLCGRRSRPGRRGGGTGR